MAKSEDGEFELILGNRQLLSVFFIVAILIGVFFAMGYIVGRNSAPGAAADGHKSDRPIVADSRPTPAGAPAEQQPAPAQQNAGSPAANSGGQPAAGNTAEEQPASAPVKPAETEKKAEQETAASVPEEPSPGQTYLQVAAVQRAEAELFVDVLGKKGFHALFASGPQGLYRVLVGPFKEAGAIAQARTDLQKAGFKGFDALVRKY